MRRDGGVALQYAIRATASRSRSRPNGETHGRCCGSCRAVRNRSRSIALRPDAGRRGDVGRHASAVASQRRQNDHARDSSQHAKRPQPRLGYRHVVFVQPGRAFPDWLVRPYRIYGHFDLDRSNVARLRDLSLEPPPSRWQRRCHATASASRDARCRSDQRRNGCSHPDARFAVKSSADDRHGLHDSRIRAAHPRHLRHLSHPA